MAITTRGERRAAVRTELVGCCGLEKQRFLSSIQNQSRKYKRYLGSPLRYAGGKSWAVGYVVERIPDSIGRLVSPFFGGGSIEIAVARELSVEVIGFDVFDILVNYWRIQIENPAALYRELAKLRPTRSVYEHIKKRLAAHWRGETTLAPVQLAAYYYFNHNLSYGPGFLGWMSSVYANPKVYRRLLDRVRTFDVKNITVECASFEEVIPKYMDDFLYCDPPYYLGEDSDLFRGLYPQRNFPIHHDGFDHHLLRDLLLDHRGGFILSYNDAPTIREWYKDFEIVELPARYTMGQGETRIGANRKAKGASYTKRSKELLIIKPARCGRS
ncbi:MAG: hypothetical protein KatS3mg082_1411 [Nitrospiraceae bacterium]|nr:MAG: hypothetical protein KatS3mg082_1411 [Nitrospiraceae bacterium]